MGQQFDDSSWSVFLCHLALWFGLVFATPVFVAANNLGDLELGLGQIILWTALLCVFISLATWQLARLSNRQAQSWICRIVLAFAFVLAIQGNLVNDLFYYGAFNGESMQFRAYGGLLYVEWVFFLLAFPLALYGLFRLQRMSVLLPMLPIASFALLISPILISASGLKSGSTRNMDIDPSVFEFSSQSNLIHLLPDGLQGDVVREVFEQHPDLAEKFRGFTLFTNHLGLYQGTAASLFTILTGEPWELESGYSSTRARQGIQSKSYQKSLYEQDYQLDYVPIDDYVCPDYVSTCYPRPFSDLKSRGYYRHQSEDVSYGLRLIGDLTLFRLTPMYLKEKIYNGGHWLMSDTAMDGSSPWPDPVLREWTQRMTIVDDRPVYKWYHYIGTHIPPHWNDQCEYFRELPRERESFKAQAYCILQGIANLADRLRESGVYDRTAFVVSSDHGHIEPPDDLHSLPYNASLDASLMGTGRPTLLIKTKNSNQALAFSDTPTSLVDVAATALHLVGIKSDQNNVSDFKNLQQRQREFTPYFIQKFWSKKPIPHVKYRVDGPASDASEWRLSDMIEFDPAPAGYDPVNFNTANRYVLGAALDRNQPDEEASWVKGRQLGFLLHIPESKTQRSMALVLKLPEWITQQALTLAVNGVQTGQTYEMGGTGDGWQTLKIPLDPTLLKPGNNFFNILFENTQSPPGEDDWHASAILKSIRVLE